jgi:hypothetical protein
MDLPIVGADPKQAPSAPASYTRLVSSNMSKAEKIVKLLMSPHDSPRLFVEDFIKVAYCSLISLGFSSRPD